MKKIQNHCTLVDMQGVSLLTASSIDIRVDPSSPSYNVFKCLTVCHMISLQNAENLKQIFPEKEYRVVMSTIPKRKYKRSDIKANYRNETKTF